jgi:hypothetical protein
VFHVSVNSGTVLMDANFVAKVTPTTGTTPLPEMLLVPHALNPNSEPCVFFGSYRMSAWSATT